MTEQKVYVMKMISAVANEKERAREREGKKEQRYFRVGRSPEAICQLVNHKSYLGHDFTIYIAATKRFATPMGLNRLQACLYHHWRITSH